jgi:hypothetical protein
VRDLVDYERRQRYLRRLASLPPDAGQGDAVDQLRDFLPPRARAGIARLEGDGSHGEQEQVNGEAASGPPLPDLLLRVVRAGESALVASGGPEIYRDDRLDSYLAGGQLYVAPVMVRGHAAATVWVASDEINAETRATVDEAALVTGIRLSLSGAPVDAAGRTERLGQRAHELAAEARASEALREAARAFGVRCDLLDPEEREHEPHCACAHHASAPVTAAGEALGTVVLHSSRPIPQSILDGVVAIAQVGILAERVQTSATHTQVATLAELTTFSDPPWLSVGSLNSKDLAAPLVAFLVTHRGGHQRQPHGRELLAAVSSALGPAAVRSPMGTRPGQVLTLLPRHDRTAAHRVAQRIVSHARDRGIDAACFISTSGIPVDVPRLIAEVERLALLGRGLQLGSRVVDADAVGAFAVFLEVAEPQRLADWANRLIGPLIAYDEEHSASLLTTLEAYLEEWGHVSACASRIFIHPNTLKYRVKRIQEILDVDPRDPLVRRDLLVACYAWRTALALMTVSGNVTAQPAAHQQHAS